MNNKSEARIQQECYIWFHNSFPELRGLLFSVPNGGTRLAREAASLKKQGLVPGVADMLFIYNTRVYAIEIKTDKGRQSKLQVKWEKAVVEQGVPYHLCRSLEQFKLIINKIVT